MDARSLQDTYAPGNACFGCGPANPKGLQVKSFVEGGDVVCRCTGLSTPDEIKARGIQGFFRFKGDIDHSVQGLLPGILGPIRKEALPAPDRTTEELTRYLRSLPPVTAEIARGISHRR